LTVRVNEEVVTESNTSHLYWTMSQQLAHVTSNGTPLRGGDLFASGTISGPEASSRGSMVEITSNTRFLDDGDVVTISADIAEFGICSGTIQPAD
jgi:fumarylacetoacetase